MRRVIKWMLILSLIFCVLGIGITAAGAMMGGIHYLGRALRDADRWDGYVEELEDWNSRHRDGSNGSERGLGKIKESLEEDLEKEISENLAEEEGKAYSLENAFLYDNIRELEIDVSGIVMVQESEELKEGQVGIIKENQGEDYEYRQDQDTLKIRWPRTRGKNREQLKTITILIPGGSFMEEMDIEVNAGEFQADILRAREISLQAKAGRIMVNQGEADTLELEADAGQIICRADVSGKVSAESDLGEICLDLKGKKEDFDYELECSVGSIVLEGSETENYQGLHHKEQLSYGAGKRAELECAAGNIRVSYWEEE